MHILHNVRSYLRAAKTEFKTLEYFYFHNCLYDYVWKDNIRRSSSRMNTWDLFNTYGRDYRRDCGR